ncbi:MAG: hypothetical protein LBF89_07690 [Bacteroidales bacterium]|nr:hypothetical protein [Bacteroidales bacterium]
MNRHLNILPVASGSPAGEKWYLLPPPADKRYAGSCKPCIEYFDTYFRTL